MDGERVESGTDCNSAKLKIVDDRDLREVSGMAHYYDNEVWDEDGVVTGINHVFCNDIDLEGTEGFKTKSIYVFYSGMIMTVDEV